MDILTELSNISSEDFSLSARESSSRLNIHFISGLPRSGSTLLGAILCQNPMLHAGMSSPLAGLFINIQNILSAKNEYSSFITDTHRSNALKAIVASYYADISADKVILDTSRAWAGKMPVLSQLFPASKVVCCVRSLGWISDSFERLMHKNPLQPSGIFGYQAGGNMASRMEHLHSSKGILGISLNNLREAFYSEHTDKLLLVRYRSLVADPAATLGAIYEFLELPPFEHDFHNIEFDAEAFDKRLGTPGLHTVRRSIGFTDRLSVLGPDLFAKYSIGEFWADEKRNTRGVRIL